MSNFDDTPIGLPEQDRFGFDPFARTISDCIRSIEKPLGSVVAIYGPWGSGKSSVVNLVRHHHSKDAPDLDVISFPAWMYRTEDALAVGFFKELYAGLSPVLSDQSKAAGALRKLGQILLVPAVWLAWPYASRMEPRSGWSGTQADTMQPRADAILALASHSDVAIAGAAKMFAGEANERIERIRRRERQRDEAREQTFE